MPGGYFIGADTDRLAWPVPIAVGEGSEVEARVNLSKGDAGDPTISFGLICSPVPINWQAMDAGCTFLPLYLDSATISHTALTQYGGTAKYGDTIPTGTAQVAMAVKFHNQERPFLDDFIFSHNTPGVVSRFETIETNVSGNTASISTEVQLRSDGDSALAVRIDTVETNVAGNAASITTEIAARSTADTALGGRIDTVETNVAGNTASITSESTARSTADAALGGRLDSVETNVAGNTASISSETAARSSADSALATRVDSYDAVFGTNAANANTSIATIANSEIAASTIELNTDANGALASVSLTSAAGTTTSTSEVKVTADQILFSAGQLLFGLTPNEAQLNKPLSVDIGTSKKLTLAPKSDIFLWKGPKATLPANMTRANAEWYLGEESTPYINGTPHTPGSFAFSRTESGRYSGASNHQSPVVNYTTQANEIKVRAVLKVTSVRYYTPAVAANVVTGESYPGSAALNIELAQAGGAYAEYYVGPQINGKMDTIWAAGPDPNHVDGSGDAFTQRVRETYTIEKEVSVTVSAASIAPGTLLQWRATIDGWTSVPSGHTPQTYLEIAVSENS